MKRILFFAVLLITASSSIFAQSAKEKEFRDKVQLLNRTIFVNRDSVLLESMIAKDLIYGHSGGKAENKSEMLKGVLSNKSIYENFSIEITNIILQKNVGIARLTLSANEKDQSGKTNPLKLAILQTWVKEKKQWKLTGRQSVKLPI